MITSQNGSLATIQPVGVKFALGNGVSEGIDAVQQDLTSLTRLTTASAVSLNTLIQLAAELSPLGSQSVLPIPPLTTALPPKTVAYEEFRPVQTSSRPGAAGNWQPVDDMQRPLPSTPAQATPWSNLGTTDLKPESQEPKYLSMPEKDVAPPELAKAYPPIAFALQPMALAQELSVPTLRPAAFMQQPTELAQKTTMPALQPMTSTLRPISLPTARASLSCASLTIAPYDPVSPVNPAPVQSADIPSAQPELDQDAELERKMTAPSHAARLLTMRSATTANGIGTNSLPHAVATPTIAHSTTVLASQPDPTLETIIALAHSLEPIMAVPTGAPVTPTAPSVTPPAPRALPPEESIREQVMPNGGSHSRSRPLSDSTVEPRQGLLILDGTQLGRWIMDSMARQATRPTSGTTGIDPRITPAFPGAPITA